jgi:hypothetical protein
VWDYEALIKYEEEEKKKISPIILEEIGKSSDMKLDIDIRLWLYINTKHIWKPGVRPNRSITTAAVLPLFAPSNLSETTPYNYIFLRFPDLSPTFLFRDIRTENAMLKYRNVSFNYF